MLLYTYLTTVCFWMCIYICMLQLYVLNILAILDVCCRSFIWMLHMFYMYVSMVSLYFSMLKQVLLPHALTCRHARTACTHPALPISVMQASSISRACTQWLVDAQCLTCMWNHMRTTTVGGVELVGMVVAACSDNAHGQAWQQRVSR
jgi:hypothetical protein